MADNGATVSLDNTTVAHNQANSDNVGVAVAGGIHQHSGAVFEVTDSLIALNTIGQGGTGPACHGDFAGGGGTLVDSTGSNPDCNFAVFPALTTTPLVGALAANGGPTQTVALMEGSPAINLGAIGCPTGDQRGRNRPANPANCDAGAFERKAGDP